MIRGITKRRFRALGACAALPAAGVLLLLLLQGPVLRGAALLLPRLDAAPCLEARLSPVMTDRNGVMLHAYLNDDEQWCFPVDLDAVSPRLVQATLAAEDKRFFSHGRRPARRVARRLVQCPGRRRGVRRFHADHGLVKRQQDKRGGSRARPPRPSPRRLERCADKDALLEAYLNTAPYGGNLVGVEAAARRYFGKSCRELTLDEAALLAGLPKSPTRMYPFPNPAPAKRAATPCVPHARGRVHQRGRTQRGGGPTRRRVLA